MGIIFAILAAVLASTSNLFLRKSIDAGGSSKANLVVQLTFSFILMIFLNPVKSGDYGWNTPAVVTGLVGGILFGLLMWGLGRTLEKGPPGLSFAVLNTSSVMPAIVLAVFFGAQFGHPYTIANGIGSLLVVCGLFWAGWTSEHNPNKAVWIFYAAFIFAIHTLFLFFLQWWAMVLKPDLPISNLLPFKLSQAHIQWFMPAIFFAGALFQWTVFLVKRHKFPKKMELVYGFGSGISNGLCTYFLILAPQVAVAWESAMIFPIFSVGIIIICNAWAQFLYGEQVNWWANLVCLTGLIVGTVAWTAF